MSDIVKRLKAGEEVFTDGLRPREWIRPTPKELEAAAEIERLRKELSETALTALSIDSRAMALSERLAEAVEVMRACRSTYVENDDATALERTIDRINAFLAKMEPKRSEDIIREDRDEWDARLEGRSGD